MPQSPPPPEGRDRREALSDESGLARFKELAKRLLAVSPAELREELRKEAGKKASKTAKNKAASEAISKPEAEPR